MSARNEEVYAVDELEGLYSRDVPDSGVQVNQF
jgi:hypothetical protein